METDEELAKRLCYVIGRQALPRGEALDRIAEEYGLKRRYRRDDFFNYGTKLMVAVDPGVDDRSAAMIYSYEGLIAQKAAEKLLTERRADPGEAVIKQLRQSAKTFSFNRETLSFPTPRKYVKP